MFETAEIGSQIPKAEYAREAPGLRTALLGAQTRLAQAPLATIVLIGGVEGAGKAETVNLLLEWMDARGIEVHAMWNPTDEERERPPMWRFWRVLPPKGKMAIFFGSWYTFPVIERTYDRIDEAAFDQHLQRIVEFERMLHDENNLVLKFWLHLSKKDQKKRLRKLEKDPRESWRVTPLDWKFFKKYDRFREVSERALRRTSTGHAPWHVIEGKDARYRHLTVARSLLGAIDERLKVVTVKARGTRVPDRPKPADVNLLKSLPLDRKLSEKDYDRELLRWQGKVNLLTRELYQKKRSMLLVFEGPDAAGKGGAIRRVLAAMDARNYQVVSFAAPTDEERARPYLWRFWRHVPRLGRVTIFDRSWYGRVLVERIEGFCAADDWRRAFGEINAFEEQLTAHGLILLKFWLHLSPAEQLRRFKDRQQTPFKQYKLTEEDWRNREKWDAYEAAACEMIERTSATSAPWVAVEANDKNWARVKVVRTVARALERHLG